MQPPVLPELAALFALRYRPALSLDFEQRAVGVVARARAVALDARMAVSQRASVHSSSRGGGEGWGCAEGNATRPQLALETGPDLPGVLDRVYEDLTWIVNTRYHRAAVLRTILQGAIDALRKIGKAHV